MAIKPIDLREIDKRAANVYEAIVVCAKRARMINDENRLEFNTYLNTMVDQEEDEFDDRDNSEQIKISLEFEKRPKPHEVALKELLDGKLKYYKREEE